MDTNENPQIVSEEDFQAQSEALASGEPLVVEVEVPDEPEVAVPPAEEKSPVKKEPKVRKTLTVHQHWLIDIRRYSKELGIAEGQKLNGVVRTKKGKKILELSFL